MESLTTVITVGWSSGDMEMMGTRRRHLADISAPSPQHGPGLNGIKLGKFYAHDEI